MNYKKFVDQGKYPCLICSAPLISVYRMPIEEIDRQTTMLITGLSKFDKAVEKQALVNHPISNHLQSCVAIPPGADTPSMAKLFREANLQCVPYCLQQALVQREHGDEVRLLHRISLPDGKPLSWLLITETGKLIEQVYCQHKGKYKQVCQSVNQFLINACKGRNQVTG